MVSLSLVSQPMFAKLDVCLIVKVYKICVVESFAMNHSAFLSSSSSMSGPMRRPHGSKSVLAANKKFSSSILGYRSEHTVPSG